MAERRISGEARQSKERGRRRGSPSCEYRVSSASIFRRLARPERGGVCIDPNGMLRSMKPYAFRRDSGKSGQAVRAILHDLATHSSLSAISFLVPEQSIRCPAPMYRSRTGSLASTSVNQNRQSVPSISQRPGTTIQAPFMRSSHQRVRLRLEIRDVHHPLQDCRRGSDYGL